MVAYELTHIIFFYILIGEREELSLDQEIISYTHFKIIWGWHVDSFIL
jgi:hypothetical protein